MNSSPLCNLIFSIKNTHHAWKRIEQSLLLNAWPSKICCLILAPMIFRISTTLQLIHRCFKVFRFHLFSNFSLSNLPIPLVYTSNWQFDKLLKARCCDSHLSQVRSFKPKKKTKINLKQRTIHEREYYKQLEKFYKYFAWRTSCTRYTWTTYENLTFYFLLSLYGWRINFDCLCVWNL